MRESGRVLLDIKEASCPKEIPPGHVLGRAVAFKTDASDPEQLDAYAATAEIRKNLHEAGKTLPAGHENIYVLEDWHASLDGALEKMQVTRGKTLAVVNPTLSDGECSNCVRGLESVCLRADNVGFGNPQAGSAVPHSLIRVNPRTPGHTLWVPPGPLLEGADPGRLFRALAYTENATVGVSAVERAFHEVAHTFEDTSPQELRYVIVGATGSQGSNVVASLLAAGVPPGHIHLVSGSDGAVRSMTDSYAAMYNGRVHGHLLPRDGSKTPEQVVREIQESVATAVTMEGLPYCNGADVLFETSGYFQSALFAAVHRGGLVVNIGLHPLGRVDGYMINADVRARRAIIHHYGRSGAVVRELYFGKLVPDMLANETHPLWRKAGPLKTLDDAVEDGRWARDRESPTYVHDGVAPAELIRSAVQPS